MYVIEVRQVAELNTGLVTDKKQVLMKWATEDEARQFGKENIEGARYIASWQAIPETVAKQRGHSI